MGQASGSFCYLEVGTPGEEDGLVHVERLAQVDQVKVGAVGLGF